MLRRREASVPRLSAIGFEMSFTMDSSHFEPAA